MYLHRDNAMLRQFFDWSKGNSIYLDTPKPSEFSLASRWVREYEGDEAAYVFEHWMVRQPAALMIVRDSGQKPIGLMLRLSIREIDAEDIAVDPWIKRCMDWVAQQGGLRPAEKGMIFRTWLDAENYHGISTVQSLCFVNAVQTYLSTPKLALSLFACSAPDFWKPLFAYAEIHHVPELDITIGGKAFAMFGHNWRTMPPMLWLDVLAKREVGAAPDTEPVTNTVQLVALSEQDFAQALRDALRDYAREDALRNNPLMRCRFVQEVAGSTATENERLNVLRSAINRCVDALTSNPRDAKLARALQITYIEPAPTQEIASERLDIPFSTYRRHLQTGIARVAEMLWAREVGGG